MRALAAALVVLAGCSRAVAVPLPSERSVADPDLAAAIDAAAEKVRAAPQDADAWAVLGMVYDANSFTSLAVSAYRRALELQPGEASWWYDLAHVLERQERHDDALAAAARAAALVPDYAPLHRNVALWELSQGRLEPAETAALRAVTISKSGAGALVTLGRVQMERGRDAEALATLRKALASWPADWGSSSYVHFLLGTVLARSGHAEEAAAELALGRGEPPSLPDPWRAEVQEHREGFEARVQRVHRLVVGERHDGAAAAIESLQELRRTHPENVQVLTDLGTAYLLTTRWDEAVAVLSEAVAAHPNALDPRLQLSRACWAAGRRDEAMRHARTAVQTNPFSADALEARGLMSLRESHAEEALADLADASRLDPTSASARALSGAACLLLLRRDAARAHFDAALRIDPQQATAIAGLAILALDQGDLPAADRRLAAVAHLRDDTAPLLAEARRRRAK